jgi:protein-tyrosine phosphatase
MAEITPNLVAINNGNIAIGHRPKLKAISSLKNVGITHVLTLLSAREDADSINKACQKAKLAWLHFPLPSADLISNNEINTVIDLYKQLHDILSSGGSIYIHCSAGIHRTGMITYGFLRFMGIPQNDAEAILQKLRLQTHKDLGEERLKWGDQFDPLSLLSQASFLHSEILCLMYFARLQAYI